MVFTHAEDLQYFNTISHPLLIQRLKERINQATVSPVVIDAALLFDWPEIMDIVDYPILVTAFEEVKKARCIARGMDRRRYQSIRVNQKNDATLSQNARFIINNNGTVEDLHDQCRSILKEIKDGHRV
jgi:dephospho-CoA kinase